MASRFQPIEPVTVRRDDARQIQEERDRAPLWMTPADVAAFVPCKTVKAARVWLRSHGIPRRGNGSVSRRDIERELHRLTRQPRRVMHPNSLRNLRKASA